MMNAGLKKNPQASDKQFPNGPTDSVSCLDCNGSQQSNSTVVVAGSWDNSVSCYEIQYMNDEMSNIVPQAQIKHDAPVLACAMNTNVSSVELRALSAHPNDIYFRTS
jgi:hypothetical protein